MRSVLPCLVLVLSLLSTTLSAPIVARNDHDKINDHLLSRRNLPGGYVNLVGRTNGAGQKVKDALNKTKDALKKTKTALGEIRIPSECYNCRKTTFAKASIKDPICSNCEKKEERRIEKLETARKDLATLMKEFKEIKAPTKEQQETYEREKHLLLEYIIKQKGKKINTPPKPEPKGKEVVPSGGSGGVLGGSGPAGSSA